MIKERQLKTYVLTSDKYNWCVGPFLHQWKKYAPNWSITVAGFTKPDAECDFVSIGKFEDYPVNKWSDALISLLHRTDDKLVCLFLEDYWLVRPVSRIVVPKAILDDHTALIRFDLTSDTIESKKPKRLYSLDQYDLFERTDPQYSLSLQAAVWNRQLLLDVLVPGETPWEVELNGSERLNKKGYRVFGTAQWPVMYTIAVNKGVLDKTGDWMQPSRTLGNIDWTELEREFGI